MYALYWGFDHIFLMQKDQFLFYRLFLKCNREKWKYKEYKMYLGSFSHSVMSDSLWPHEPQHTRPPCSLPTPGVYANPCPSNRWCHPAISSSVVPFSSCPQSFWVTGSFHMSQLFTSGGQRIGVSASALVLPMNIQDWFSLGWTPCSPRDSQKSSPTP